MLRRVFQIVAVPPSVHHTNRLDPCSGTLQDMQNAEGGIGHTSLQPLAHRDQLLGGSFYSRHQISQVSAVVVRSPGAKQLVSVDIAGKRAFGFTLQQPFCVFVSLPSLLSPTCLCLQQMVHVLCILSAGSPPEP